MTVTDLNINIKNAITDTSNGVVSALCFGFGCVADMQEKLSELICYQKVLARHIKAGVNSCLDSEALACLTEKIISLTGTTCDITCTDLIIDESGVEQWRFKHKDCTGHEFWERWVHYVCGQIEFDTTILDRQKEVIYEIDTTKKNLDTIYDIDTVTKTEKNTMYEFEVLKSEVSCDITFNTYKKLLTCNIDSKIIKEVYSCGLSLVVREEEVGCQVSLKVDKKLICFR